MPFLGTVKFREVPLTAFQARHVRYEVRGERSEAAAAAGGGGCPLYGLHPARSHQCQDIPCALIFCLYLSSVFNKIIFYSLYNV